MIRMLPYPGHYVYDVAGHCVAWQPTEVPPCRLWDGRHIFDWDQTLHECEEVGAYLDAAHVLGLWQGAVVQGVVLGRPYQGGLQ